MQTSRREILATLLSSLIVLPGCGKPKILPKPPRPVVVNPPLPILNWIRGQVNPDRVELYLDTRPIKIQKCVNGVCQLFDAPNPISEKLKNDLILLREKDWVVGEGHSQHIQIVSLLEDSENVSLKECPVAIKFKNGKEHNRVTFRNMTAPWVTKFFHDSSIEIPVESKKTGRSYPKTSYYHQGVVGECWQDYYNHLVTSANHKEMWQFREELKQHTLESLTFIHDASHFLKVELQLV